MRIGSVRAARHLCIALIAPFALCAPDLAHAADGDASLFDAHLHYNAAAAARYPVAEALALLRAQGVAAAVVSSTPNAATRALFAASRGGTPIIVPFVRPYRTDADRSTWFDDPAVAKFVEDELASGAGYRGIGEFHVHGAADAGGRTVKRIVDLAVARGLWLHAHCDDAALEAIFAHDPRVRVIWAHTGFTTPLDKLRAYLDRHPALVAELSYRSDVASNGKVAPAWRELFVRYPDRFLLGSDTWVDERWDAYGEMMRRYRHWLADLPSSVAHRIGWENGARMFGLAPR